MYDPTLLARARRRALPVRPDLLDVLVQARRNDADPEVLAEDLHAAGVGTPGVARALEALTFHGLLTDDADTKWRADLTYALHCRWQQRVP